MSDPRPVAQYSVSGLRSRCDYAGDCALDHQLAGCSAPTGAESAQDHWMFAADDDPKAHGLKAWRSEAAGLEPVS